MNTPQKALHEPAPLRSEVAPQRCLLSSVCVAKIRSFIETTKFFCDFFFKKGKKKVEPTSLRGVPRTKNPFVTTNLNYRKCCIYLSITF